MRTASAEIADRRDELARAVVDIQFERWPALYARYGEYGHDKCVEDVAYHLDYLAEAVGSDSPELFAEYARWVRSLFIGLGIPDEELADSLGILRDVVTARVGGAAAEATALCVAAALHALPVAPSDPPSLLNPAAPHADVARDYLDFLLAGDRRAASARVLDAVYAGLAVRDAYLHVFQPVLREVGRLWQTGRITVAHEHFVTAATQAVMSQLYPHIFQSDRRGHSLVATCVSGEMHEVGVRMVADFFEMAGWDTYYLGANAPARAIVEAVRERNAEVLAVSATITPHVGPLARLVAAVRKDLNDRRLFVIVGGYPFNTAPELWRKVGADGSATDAVHAVELAESLLAAASGR